MDLLAFICIDGRSRWGGRSGCGRNPLSPGQEKVERELKVACGQESSFPPEVESAKKPRKKLMMQSPFTQQTEIKLSFHPARKLNG